MLSRILSFYAGLGLPAAILIVTVMKLTNRAIAYLAVFAGVFIVSTILISIQRLPDYRTRFLLALGPGAIAFLTHGAVVSVAIWDSPTPWWLYGLRLIVPILAGAILALAIATITRPWRQGERRTVPDAA